MYVYSLVSVWVLLLRTGVQGLEGSGRITRAFAGNEWDLTRNLISAAPLRTVEWLNSTSPVTMFAADDAAWTRTAKALGRVPLTEISAYNDVAPYIKLEYHVIGGQLLDEAKLLTGGDQRTLDGRLLTIANGSLRHNSSMPVPIIKRRLYDADQLVVWRIDHLAFHSDPPRRGSVLWECFPVSALVTTSMGEKRMDELQIGDQVRVAADKDGGTSIWSEVVTFSHRDLHTRAEFVRIEIQNRADTGGIQALELTQGHFVHLVSSVRASTRAADGVTVRAGDVRVGDWIRTMNGAEQVRRVKVVRRRGLFAPHTYHGDIVVHGVVVSCYTEVIPIAMGHAALAPIRAIAKVCLGCARSGFVTQMRGMALQIRAAIIVLGMHTWSRINK